MLDPSKELDRFPTSNYEHIPGSMHEDKKKWQNDLATRERDAFFVCCKRDDWQGRWLGGMALRWMMRPLYS